MTHQKHWSGYCMSARAALAHDTAQEMPKYMYVFFVPPDTQSRRLWSTISGGIYFKTPLDSGGARCSHKFVTKRVSYKRVKGRSHTVEKRKASHPQKPHATSRRLVVV